MKTIFFFFFCTSSLYIFELGPKVDKPNMKGYVGFGFGGVKKIVIYVL
jgi:hypothetical protein